MNKENDMEKKNKKGSLADRIPHQVWLLISFAAAMALWTLLSVIPATSRAFPNVFKVGRATYFGDVSAHLANLVIKHLGYKARSEKPGLLGRASIALSSDVDRREAILAGEEAVRAACAGENGKMVGFIRESTSPYRARTTLIDVNDVMLVEKKMPDEYINEAGNGVTQAFLDWCAPLIGEPLGKLISLR